MENPNMKIKEMKKMNLISKCDKCSYIPNFTLYNYTDCIKLNMICKENHSFTTSLNDYIKKINDKNLNIKIFVQNVI